jgi:hypothetical protein
MVSLCVASETLEPACCLPHMMSQQQSVQCALGVQQLLQCGDRCLLCYCRCTLQVHTAGAHCWRVEDRDVS